MAMNDKQPLFKVSFINQGRIYEVYVRNVYEADIYGFIALEEWVFGESTTVVIDPSEERLRNEFANVKRSFIPMHSIIRIDEVDRRGKVKIIELDGNVTQLPNVTYSKGRTGSE